MYSTKIIENILISALQNNRADRKPILSDTLSENTRSQYRYFEDINTIKEVLARTEYSQAVEAYKNGHRIYRGQKRQEEHLAALVMPGTRRSKDGSNFYTRLMSDILPSWSKYPKRNKSTICTNNRTTAKDYSDRYIFVIFPKNNTKIGVCPKGDIWYSFPFLERKTDCDLYVFTAVIRDFICFVLNLAKSKFDEISFDEIFLLSTTQDILSLFRLVENKCQTELNKLEYEQILKNTRLDFLETYLELFDVTQKSELLKYFEYLLNPTANKFQLITVDKVPRHTNYNTHELWFEGQHLMIREDVASKLTHIKNCELS